MVAIALTIDGHNLIRDSASGVDRFIITHFALGSSNTAVGSSDHTLGNEQFRKAISSFANGGSTGEIIISVYVAAGDAVGLNIQEIGIYGGNSASSIANSGVLIARALYVPSTNPKTALISLQLSLDLIC